MIAALRARPGLVLFVLAIVIGSVAALRAELDEGAMTTFALVSVIAMVLGEQLPMQISRQTLAPLMTAPALGLALTPAAFDGARPSASTVLALIWVSVLAGGLIARRRGASGVE